MSSILDCVFLHLLGPKSFVPVWGLHEDLSSLNEALNAGQTVSASTSSTGLPDAQHAMKFAVDRLRQAGKVPDDIEKVQSLTNDQREALGFPSMELDPTMSMQDFAIPAFKELDMLRFMHGLRFLSRYQELKATGAVKPVFRVGVVTLQNSSDNKHFFALTMQSEPGVVTDTIWLFRHCEMGPGDEYEEHWLPFEGPMVTPVQQTVVPPVPETEIDSTAPEPPNNRKRKASDTDPTTPSGPSLTQKPPPKRTRFIRHQTFNHTHLSDAELFAVPPDLIQGTAILRLAHNYSNQQIFNSINAATPNGVRSVNVITKRLTHAIEAEAMKSGKSAKEIRAGLVLAKKAAGVVHKGKADVTRYG